MKKLLKFLKSRKGATATEYAVMLALIIIVALAAIQLLGQNVRDAFNSIATTLGAAIAPPAG